jgi:hypothetical protein
MRTFSYNGSVAECRFRHNFPLGLSSGRRQILVNFFENFLANAPHYLKNFEKNFLKIVKILIERAFGDRPIKKPAILRAGFCRLWSQGI